MEGRKGPPPPLDPRENPLDVFHPGYKNRARAPAHSAASSHVQVILHGSMLGRACGIIIPLTFTQNDKYMDDFDKAWHEMNGLTMQP